MASFHCVSLLPITAIMKLTNADTIRPSGRMVAAKERIASVDLPPLKWSSLKYDFRMEDEIDGEEEAYG